MKNFNLLFMFLPILSVITSCGSLEGNKQRMDKISYVHGPIGVNSYGYFHIKGEKSSCTTVNDYKGLIKNLEKAVEWDGKKKSSNISKEIDSYSICKMKVSYEYNAKRKQSFVSFCFQNPAYQHIIDLDCASVVNISKALADLKKAPAHMKKLNQEIKEMESLK